MRVRACALAMLMMLLGACGGASGQPTGSFDSLEEEAAAQMDSIVGLLDAALPSYSVEGTRVNVGPCEPIGGWKVGTELLVGTGDLSPEEGLEAIVAELESRGADGERPADESEPGGADYRVDLGEFGGSLWMYWSLNPLPTIALVQPGGCYGEDQVLSDDPHDIEIEEGPILVFRDS